MPAVAGLDDPEEPPMIGQTQLSLAIRSADVDLGALAARVNDASRSSSSSRGSGPSVSVDVPKDELELPPLGELTLREIISHADDGRAVIRLPIFPTTIKLGPLSAEIVDGTVVLIELEIKDGLILRDKTRGTVEPPIKLPLGTSLKGIYLSDSGDVVADIDNFPNVNVSLFALKGKKIPERLKDVLAMIFPDTPPGQEKPAEEAAPGPVQFDVDHLTVEAFDVQPNDDPFVLGEGVRAVLGPDTLLHITYEKTKLGLAGKAQIADGKILGDGFHLDGLKGDCNLAVVIPLAESKLPLTVEVRDLSTSIGGAEVELADGSALKLSTLRVSEGAVDLKRTSKKLSIDVPRAKIQGKVDSGRLVVKVGDERVPVEAGPLDISGTVSFSDARGMVDVEVERGSIRLRDLEVPLAILSTHIHSADAELRGRLRYSTDAGVAFKGALEAAVDVDRGRLDMDVVHATVVEGTRASLSVREIDIGAKGLESLDATGEVSIVLASGSLPIGRTSSLSFTRGAEGRLALTKIQARAGGRWPFVEGTLGLSARSDACALDPLVEIPAGDAGLEIGNFTLDETGVLTLSDVAIALIGGVDVPPTQREYAIEGQMLSAGETA
jgi:hypothetical protein